MDALQTCCDSLNQQQQRRHGYEDLDDESHHQSSSTEWAAAHNNDGLLSAPMGSPSSRQHQRADEPMQGQRAKVLSASDTAIHLVPIAAQALDRRASCENPTRVIMRQHPSALSLGQNISIGSIRLVRDPYMQAYPQNSHSSAHAVEQPANNGQDSRRTSIKHPHVWLCCYVWLYVAYLAVGGIVFPIFETHHELGIRAHVQDLRRGFLLKYPQISDDDLEVFLKAIITANDRGISPLRNSSNEMNWSFGQALFFSSTVITTIGYGHVTPLSQTGKIFCMIYAAIGIPLTLVLLSALVERLLVPANWFLGTLNSKLGHLYQPFNIRVLHLTIIVLCVAVLFFALPTALFAYIEPSWGALDSFYYCFISLTTIGLGDYIPGEGVSIENHSLYKMLITGYLIFGLIAMMLILTIFYDIPQLNLGQLFTESVSGGEKEKLRLSSSNAPCYSGTVSMYMPQRDEDTRAVVRIRPHHDDSPSPDEPSTNQSDPIKMP